MFALKSKTSKNFKTNFSYFTERMSPMGCVEEDSQEHAMLCVPMNPISSRNHNIVYEDIFIEDINIQAAVTKLFSTLLERREDANSEDIGPSSCAGEPGQCIDPDICTHCIDV